MDLEQNEAKLSVAKATGYNVKLLLDKEEIDARSLDGKI